MRQGAWAGYRVGSTFVALLTLFLAGFSGPVWSEVSSLVEIQRADVLIAPYTDEAPLPLESDERWRNVSLREQVPNPSLKLIRVWFRMHFDLKESMAEPMGMLLPRMYSGGTIFLNGAEIGAVSSSSTTFQAHWLRPHLFSLPASLLRPGENEILVSTPSRYYRVGLAPPLVGASSALRFVHQYRDLLEHTLAAISIVMLLSAGIALFTIWYFRQDDLQYGLFGLAALAWGVRTINFVWALVPLEIWLPWRAVYDACTGYSIVLLCLFILRAAGFSVGRIRLVLLAYPLTGALGILIWGHEFQRWEVAWYSLGVLLNLVTALLLLSHAWKIRTAQSLWLAFPPVAIFLAFLWDYAVKAEWMPFAHVFVAHVVAPVVVFAMGLLLLQQFVNMMGQLRNVNQQLEEKVALREADIVAKQASIISLESARAAAQERERLMQDMHDGLGSQLITSLRMVEKGNPSRVEMEEILRSCIDDMRLVIDATSPQDNDILSALGSLRCRLMPRLQMAGIELSWQVETALDAIPLDQQSTLGLLRIIQEILANALKHSAASRVTVRISAAEGQFRLKIADNGKGFPFRGEGTTPVGRGLANVRRRAERIGARVLFGTAGVGTEFELILALP